MSKYKLPMILAIVGVIMILTGLLIHNVTEKNKLYYEVVEKTDRIEKLEIEVYELSDEIIQLRWENNMVWDMYYSGVGGEYCE